MSTLTSSNFNRTLSGLFTNPTFKPVLKTGDSEYLKGRLKKYNSMLSIEQGSQVVDVISVAYRYLGRNYRNEYIYKNTIANKILLGRHNLNTATMLSEFKVGGSIADLVILNGTSTVYEIKTELDWPDKLQKQIDDYKKAFAEIYLVTHHSLEDRYMQLIRKQSVGLYTLNSKFQLSLVKEAIPDYRYLDNSTMMKCLRKGEYTNIIRDYFGKLPDVTNIKYFSSCLEQINKISAKELHSRVLVELRKRSPEEKECLSSRDLPIELKHICLCINPSKQEYHNLLSFLQTNL